jgi:SAM-dependent methyltransferase
MLDRTVCPLTGSDRLHEAVRVPYDQGVLGAWSRERSYPRLLQGRDFVVRENPEIGFWFQEGVLDEREMVQGSSATAERMSEAERFRLFTLRELSHRAEDAILVRLLHRGSGRPKVFDFGMSTGEWLLLAQAYGAEAWGTDIDPRSADVCRRHGMRFVTLEDAPEDTFDFINADQVVEHLADPLGAVRSLASKLARGGILKLTVPGDRKIRAKLGRLAAGGYDPGDVPGFLREFEGLSPLCHINLFTARSLVELGTRAGLRPFRIPLGTSYGAMTGFFSGKQWNRNLLHPWKRHRARGTWQFFVRD